MTASRYSISFCTEKRSPMAQEIGFDPWSSPTINSKMVLDAFLLKTQKYKIMIKGKEEQSMERNGTLPYNSV